MGAGGWESLERDGKVTACAASDHVITNRFRTSAQSRRLPCRRLSLDLENQNRSSTCPPIPQNQERYLKQLSRDEHRSYHHGYATDHVSQKSSDAA
jgi:hypothetical protein